MNNDHGAKSVLLRPSCGRKVCQIDLSPKICFFQSLPSFPSLCKKDSPKRLSSVFLSFISFCPRRPEKKDTIDRTAAYGSHRASPLRGSHRAAPDIRQDRSIIIPAAFFARQRAALSFPSVSIRSCLQSGTCFLFSFSPCRTYLGALRYG